MESAVRSGREIRPNFVRCDKAMTHTEGALGTSCLVWLLLIVRRSRLLFVGGIARILLHLPPAIPAPRNVRATRAIKACVPPDQDKVNSEVAVHLKVNKSP